MPQETAAAPISMQETAAHNMAQEVEKGADAIRREESLQEQTSAGKQTATLSGAACGEPPRVTQ